MGDVSARDHALLASALAPPQASVLGVDAYVTLEDKATALLHSLARNHALVDGNKRLALATLIAFLGLNGRRLTLSNDEAYDHAGQATSDVLGGPAVRMGVVPERRRS